MAYCEATSTLLSASLDSLCQWHALEKTFVKTFRCLGGKFTVVSISAKGDIAVSGSLDGMLRCWNVSSGAEVARLKGHDGEVHSLSLTSDGRYSVTGSDDERVLVWHMDSSRKMAVFALDTDMSKGLRSVSLALKPPNPGEALRMAVACNSGLLCPLLLNLPGVLGESTPVLSVPQLTMEDQGGPSDSIIQSRDNLMSMAFDVDSSFFFASDEAIGGMTGDLTCHLPIPERNLRVYISCVTLNEDHERSALLGKVYPMVRRHALARGVNFYMSTEYGPFAVLDREDRFSARIHELTKCQRESKGISFIALTDNRDSPKHLAARLSVQTFESLCEIFKPAAKSGGGCCVIS